MSATMKRTDHARCMLALIDAADCGAGWSIDSSGQLSVHPKNLDQLGALLDVLGADGWTPDRAQMGDRDITWVSKGYVTIHLDDESWMEHIGTVRISTEAAS